MDSDKLKIFLDAIKKLSPSNINNFLTKHLNENNLTYYEHLKRSLSFYNELQTGAIKASVHAFIPFLFENSTTDLVNKLKEELEQELEEDPESEIEQELEEESETQANNNKKDE
tara:strand:+ start:2746 stop:3087 length:342 start_codon:yes stop_codon:yes gene_type:complete